MTNEEIIKLIQNNISTKENYMQLYQQNSGFIFNIVKKYHYGIYEIDDLMQQAYFGLVQAVSYYNPTLEETSFLQLLKFCIKTSISELKGMPRNFHSLMIKYKRIKKEIEEATSETPTDAEMMLYMNISKKQLNNIKTGLLLQGASSLDEPLAEDTNTTKKDLLFDEVPPIETQLEEKELKTIMQQAINTLPGTIKKVMIERYENNKTLEIIGKELNQNKEHISRLEYKGLQLLRKNRDILNSLEGYITTEIKSTKAYYNKAAGEVAAENINMIDMRDLLFNGYMAACQRKANYN